MLSSAFAAESFAGPLAAALAATGIGIPENVLKSVCLLVITVVLAYFNLVFGELVPKRVAMKKSESLALGLSGLLAAVYKISAPLVWLLTVSHKRHFASGGLILTTTAKKFPRKKFA